VDFQFLNGKINDGTKQGIFHYSWENHGTKYCSEFSIAMFDYWVDIV
jgi:hypothetical protein